MNKSFKNSAPSGTAHGKISTPESLVEAIVQLAKKSEDSENALKSQQAQLASNSNGVPVSTKCKGGKKSEYKSIFD